MGERNDPPLGYVHINRVPEEPGGTIPYRRYCDVAGAVPTENGTITHVHPPVAVAGYTLSLAKNLTDRKGYKKKDVISCNKNCGVTTRQ